MFLQDTLIIPETPDKEATHESAPSGEVKENPNPAPNLFQQETPEIPRSLSAEERKEIIDKKKMRATPAGQGQAEIRKRQYESRTGAEEWAELITEEYNGEEDPNNSMSTDMGTMGPTTPTRSNKNQDENLNRISPKQTTVSLQSAKEIENVMLKKQIETMSKHAEQMAAQNDRYRQRNENLETWTTETETPQKIYTNKDLKLAQRLPK